MDVGKSSLPDSVNPNNFPAKLWRLVNNPANKAIRWDSEGEIIIIDQHLFERQILSPGAITADSPDAFKTTNFSSFVRQLNLYGFKKADTANRDSHQPARDSGTYHQFCNPNFKRNHPEFVASLRRLTADNKARLQAGQTVNCKPPSRYKRFSGGDAGKDKNVKRGSSSLLGPTHQESAHPYYPNKTKAITAHDGTPVPPRYLMRGHAAALSPTVLAADKGIPVSLSHRYTGVASSSNVLHIQQAHVIPGNPNSGTFNPPIAQYQPGIYYPVCNCCQPNFVPSHVTGNGIQTGSFSPDSYYQARYPAHLLGCGDHHSNLQNKQHQELKKCDINLDTVFQIADQVMQTPPISCPVRVVTPEKPGPVLMPPNTSNTILSERPASTMQASCARTIIVAASSKADLVTLKQQEESVLPVPEQMPEDAIIEVTSDDAKDTEVNYSNNSRVTRQAYNSSCTGSTPNL